MLGQTLAQYRIEALLGAGGLGVVYRAYDTRLQRSTAIKVLGEGGSELNGAQLLHEARSASALNHPNACTIYEIGEHAGRGFIAMEYVEGRPLSDVARERGALPLEDVVRYGTQIAEALAHAHARGVIHRDLKAANVMLTDDDRIKVLDFGLAVRRPGPGQVDSAASTGPLEPTRLVGTLAYMAPELLRGFSPSVRSDLWSLGVMLYELACGGAPFCGATPYELSAAILHDAPVAFPASVPVTLRAIVGRCLAKAATQRYQSASEVRAALLTLRSGVTELPSLPAPQRAPGARRSVLVLPFANLGPDTQADYFSDGLTDEVITDLSALRALRVISRTSSMRLKGSQRPMREIAAEVGVEYVLEGSVRRQGNALRVTAQLVDAALDSPIWAHKYAGTLDDVFTIQETLSRSIVEALELQLSAEEERKMTERPIGDPATYDVYLRARQQLYRYSHEGLEAALGHLREGLASAGENVLLLSALGHVHWQYVNAGLANDTSHLDQASEYARRILSVEPESPHGHRLLGLCSLHRGDLQNAVRRLRWAAAGDANDVDTLMWLSLIYTLVGRAEQAEPLVARVLELDPLTPLHRALPTAVAISQGRFRQAVTLLEPHCAANDDNPGVRLFFGVALVLAGEHERACQAFDALEAAMSGSPFAQLGNCFAHALRGERERALSCVDEEVKQAFRADPQYSLYLADAYALAGAREEALAWSEQAVRRGLVNYPLLATLDPCLAAIREEPRFRALLAEVWPRWESFEV